MAHIRLAREESRCCYGSPAMEHEGCLLYELLPGRYSSTDLQVVQGRDIDCISSLFTPHVTSQSQHNHRDLLANAHRGSANAHRSTLPPCNSLRGAWREHLPGILPRIPHWGWQWCGLTHPGLTGEEPPPSHSLALRRGSFRV